jgi:alpha-1,3-rhamnosyl/mannosyltransferase
MNVLFGADAIRYPLTGIGRYAYELGSRLPGATGIESVRYFRDGGVHSGLPKRPDIGRTERAGVGLRRLAGSLPMLAEAYHRFAVVLQERSLREFRDYVFHGPNYYLPVHSGPCVATFHDLSVFKWPDCHPAARVRHMQKELPRAIKRAQVLLTDSEFTRQEVSAYFGWPLNRIVVAPLAASSDYHPMAPAEAAPVLSRWGLCFGAYSLFVGTLDPRKNIDLLLDAYERMPNLLRGRIPLVVAGFEGWKSEKTIARLRAGERAGWARYLGFVDETSLPSLYAGARVFLYPSRYEGFGLPVLEAMAAGGPVICSDAASLPEVTGGTDGAVLVASGDADAFYDALIRALEDDAWCENARDRGLERAKHFSWDKTVSATLTAYKLAGQ